MKVDITKEFTTMHSRKAPIRGSFSRGMSELLKASSLGDLARVQAALARGDNPNWKNPRGYTCLMLAVSNGHDKVVELLLQQPTLDLTAISAPDSGSFTALHFGCRSDDNVVGVRMLVAVLGLGEVDKRSRNGLTPLQVAVVNASLECIKLLVKVEGVNLETRRNDGKGLEVSARQT